MFDWHHIQWLYSLSGFCVGLLIGVTGVGGGSLMTPLLILVFGIAPGTAVGTDLLHAAVTKGSGVIVHGYHRTVDWPIVRRLAAGSIPATILTLYGLSRIGLAEGSGAHRLITVMLGFTLIVTALSLTLHDRILARLAPVTENLNDRRRLWITVTLGIILGICVSISSVGVGAIGVTVLILLYPSLPMVRVVGSDIAHAVPLTLVAGIGHWLIGTINWPVFFSLIIGSVPGIMISSHIAAYIPDKILRPVLAGTLMVVGLRLAI